MRAVYTERSLPDSWYPERQLIDTLNAHNPLLWTAFTIGSISADQHKQISIRREARSFQLRGGFIKQN
jgi:hypothetical protein